MEAPGTAPGSDGFIAKTVYRYSQKSGRLNITHLAVNLQRRRQNIIDGVDRRQKTREMAENPTKFEAMKQYLNLLQRVLDDGVERTDRTDTGTLGVFGHQMRFDIGAGFPLLTTKKLHLRSIIHELLWFLAGDTNIAYLQENGVKIWDDWADEKGELGPVYGKQWRSWETTSGAQIDQVKNLVARLQKDPFSRRHIVTAWNPADVEKMALPPCHCLFQFYVAPTKSGKMRLSCQLYQRSADIFLGVPFNIASYALLTLMLAQVCDMEAGDFVHTLGDAHLYLNHLDQAREQLSRTPTALPMMRLDPQVRDLFAFTYDSFTLEGYEAQPHIRAPIAV